MSLSRWAVVRAGVASLGATLFLVAPVRADDHRGEKTDILYMDNGDRLTCEIKSLDAGALYIGLDYVDGTITVNWAKVKRLESKRLFIVRLESGLVYTGSLAVVDTTTEKGKEEQLMELTDLEGHQITLHKDEVVTMGKTSGTFWRRFVVDLSGGLTYAKGNEATQYNFNTMIQYPRERWGVIANFGSTLQSSAGVTASTRNQFTLNGYHLLPWKNYFVGGTGALLQSTEQGIDLQANLGAGIGYYLSNTDHVRLSVLGGFGFQSTTYNQAASGDAAAEDLVAGLIAVNLSLVTYSKTNLTISAYALPALSDPGRFFFNTNASYYLKLWSNLKLNLTLYGNFDTRPPAGLSGSDYGLSSGLGWTFGSRQPQ